MTKRDSNDETDIQDERVNLYKFYIKTYTLHHLFQFRHLLLKHRLEAERLKRHTVTHEMLAHGLDPVQTQAVQHGRRALHDDEHGNGEEEPDGEEEENGKDARGARHAERVGQRHAPEHNRELLVSE